MGDWWTSLGQWIWAREAALAGAAGATVVSLVEWRGWPTFIRHLIVGMLCAIYAHEIGVTILTPVFSITTFDEGRKVAAGAFATGASGVFIVQFILETARAAVSRAKVGGEQ
jgi:hypothetical protein